MRLINLSGKNGFNKQTIIDDDDYVKVSKYKKWHLTKNRSKFYPRTSFNQNGKIINLKLHSLIMGKKDGLVIDHINGNTLDNRKSNLKFVTPKENNQNRLTLGKKNKSGVIGVYWSLGKRSLKHWVASIRHNDKPKYLGRFLHIEDAIKARKDAEKLYYYKYHEENLN